MLRFSLAFPVLLLVSSSGLQDQPPATEFKIPPEAAQQRNPITPTPDSLARAKKMYGYDCAMCHGASGDGKGSLTASMNLTVPDFTTPDAFKGTTDGELFYIIKNGKNQMPPEGDRAKTDEMWNLVIYIRSLAPSAKK